MTNNQTTIALRDAIYEIPSIEDFINAVMTIPDQNEAAKLVAEQAGLFFDMTTGGELNQMEADISDALEPFTQSRVALTEQQKQLSYTMPTVKAAAYLKERNQQSKAAQMSFATAKDMLVGTTSLLLGCTVVLMGASNVYSIIMASGTPAFLENPKLAMMLSGLLPIGSVALKFFSNYLPHDKAKKRYTITIYALSALSLLAWIILFGKTFHSAGSGIDWSSFGAQENEASQGDVFTVVQLLAELFVGATLFIVTGDIFSTYSPTMLLPNPAYEERRQNIESMRINHEKLADDFKRKQTRFEVLQAARKAYINTQLAIFMRQSARLNGMGEVSLNQQKEKKPMKNLLLKSVCTGALLLSLSTPVQAKTYLIGLSPALDQLRAQNQTKEVLQFLTREIKPGEQATIFDAWEVKTIGTFSVPESSFYNNEKAKLQLNRTLVGKLMDISSADHSALRSDVKGAVKLPQFLEFLGQNYAPLEDTDILVLGSPIYDDLNLPQMSMSGGRLAGDGHFSAPASDTPFSLLGKEGLLKGARVHLFIHDRNWAINDSYAYLVKRMWTLFIEGQGATLSSFTDDPQTFWARAARRAGALPHHFKRERTKKLETLVIRQAENRSLPIYVRKLSATPPSLDTFRHAQNVEIGVSWNCQDCDVDLFVRPYRTAHALYFANTQTPEGFYQKDFTQSPLPLGGYETVSFTVPLDLQETLIAINWYGGFSPSGINGEIRLAIGEQTYALPFQITATSGNQSVGQEETLQSGKPANEHWLVIDPKAFFGF